MLTDSEKIHLQSLLNHAVKPSDALTLDQLAGYLFGLAITPDATEPGEWFADIFGESLASFDDGEEADKLFGGLMDTFRRLHTLRRMDKLDFPFDLSIQDAAMLDRVRQWAVGLDRALALRAYIWMPEEVLDMPEMDEDNEAIMNCLLIVLGVAHPEKIPDIFEGLEDGDEKVKEVWANLVGQLPKAVDALQEHAAFLERGQDDAESGASTEKNDLCPCGSGKKYNRCCGLN